MSREGGGSYSGQLNMHFLSPGRVNTPSLRDPVIISIRSRVDAMRRAHITLTQVCIASLEFSYTTSPAANERNIPVHVSMTPKGPKVVYTAPKEVMQRYERPDTNSHHLLS